VVWYFPRLLETSKTPKNGEKKIFFFQKKTEKTEKKNFFSPFFEVFEVSNNRGKIPN